MPLTTSVLYRGPLASCNYGCFYCPFAKREASQAELHRDEMALQHFCKWVARQESGQLSIFFTPAGEALTFPWYREAMVELGALPHVNKVVAQTNLSCDLDWIARADAAKTRLWCTFHPNQTSLAAFRGQCERLRRYGIGFSAGCVGLKEHIPHIRQLRDTLPADCYVWVNAFKEKSDYYDTATLDILTLIDPFFPINNKHHPSLGRACQCGSTVFAVDGDGNIRRCHFVPQILGNIRETQLDHCRAERTCPNLTCGCHIGYVHLDHLQLGSLFGDGLLERIPIRLPHRRMPCEASE